MTYDELVRLVTESGTDDWIQFENHSTFKRDLNVRIVNSDPENPRPFDEPWAVKFPDRHATASPYRLFYGNSLVSEFAMASVDGDRAILPFPAALDNLVITPLKYAIACAVNSDHERLLEYLERAGLVIFDDSLL